MTQFDMENLIIEFEQVQKEFKGIQENEVLKIIPGGSTWAIYIKKENAFVGDVWLTEPNNLVRDRFTAHVFSKVENMANDPLEAATLAWEIAVRDLKKEEISRKKRAPGIIIAHNRGHRTYMENDRWLFWDTGLPTNRHRLCKRCGKPPTKEDHDGCLGTLKNVKYACCGHRYSDTAYIHFQNGTVIRGEEALRKMAEMIAISSPTLGTKHHGNCKSDST